MPKGISNKKSAKQVPVKRKYTKRKSSEQEPPAEMETAWSNGKTRRELIIEHLEARHVQFTDRDGHIGIASSQMVDMHTMDDLMSLQVQAVNARLSEDGTPYIAVYY